MNRRRKLAIASTLLLQWEFFLLRTLFMGFDSEVEACRSFSQDAESTLPGDLLLLVLSSPLFIDLLKLRRRKRFWAAARGHGVWETQFLNNFSIMGMRYPDWENAQYIHHFRLSKDAFWRMHRKYGHLFDRQVTVLRMPVLSDKRLAMTIHYLAQGFTFSQLSLMYSVGHTTAVNVVHDTIDKLFSNFVRESIRFPAGDELGQVIADFEHLYGGGLPQCAGAVDGTFMHIRKPTIHGDSYWCYKNYTAIFLLACVDARGVFMYVNAGCPGSTGDASVFNYSLLARNVHRRKWLGTHNRIINGVDVQPYLVGDSAFALSPMLLKCYA